MEARELKFAARRAGVEKQARGPGLAGRPETKGRRRAEAQHAARSLSPATAALLGSSPRPPGQGENEPRYPPGYGPGQARDLDSRRGKGAALPTAPLQNCRGLEDAGRRPSGAVLFCFHPRIVQN